MSEPAISATNRAREMMIDAIDAMRRQTAAYDLPALPEAVDACLAKLEQNTFELLVVGEMKRGKSSLANALIGSDLLPTDVDVATSQVFRVRHSATPAARIMFEDGSTREIALDELSRYGCQMAADAVGELSPDRIIRWIEVDYPARFLPPWVHLLDTPGVGSLYAGHAVITERFVPHADAVVFVVDSLEPIKAEEIAFLKSILDATPHVFFVQTKIDLVGRDAWQEMLARNEQILADTFGDRLANQRIWPISNQLLRTAATTVKYADVYRQQSQHPRLMQGLSAFLDDATVWSRVAAAWLAADAAYRAGRRTLAARYKALSRDTQTVMAEFRQEARRNLAQFEAEWGEQGQKTRNLRDALRRQIALGQQSFEKAIRPGGRIAVELKEEIEALPDRQAATHYAQDLGVRLVARVAKEWRDASRITVERSIELLPPFHEAIEAPFVEVEESLPEEQARLKFRGTLWDKVKASWNEARIVLSGTFLVGGAAAVASSPLAPFLAVAGAAAAFFGWQRAEERMLDEMRTELTRNVDRILQRLNRWLFEPDQAADRFGRVEEQFRRIEAAIDAELRKLSLKKRQEAEAEIARMIEEAELDPEKRQARAQCTREQLATWNDIRTVLQTIQELLGQKHNMSHSSPETVPV